MPARVPAAVLAALATLLALTLGGCESSARGEAAATVTPSSTKRPAVESYRSTRTYAAVAGPVRLRIPAIHVESTLMRLGRAADRTIAVPDRPERAGWYAEGPRPGQPGPAVLLGHVDWGSGPAVFFRLSELRAGADIYVDRADGSTARFRVTGKARYPKTRFPTDLVYSPSLAPSLRLITCGGAYNPATREYRDNVIVFAAPA